MDFEDFDGYEDDFSDGFEDANESNENLIDDPLINDTSQDYPLDEWEEAAILGGMSEEIAKEKNEQRRIIDEFDKESDQSPDFGNLK